MKIFVGKLEGIYLTSVIHLDTFLCDICLQDEGDHVFPQFFILLRTSKQIHVLPLTRRKSLGRLLFTSAHIRYICSVMIKYFKLTYLSHSKFKCPFSPLQFPRYSNHVILAIVIYDYIYTPVIL